MPVTIYREITAVVFETILPFSRLCIVNLYILHKATSDKMNLKPKYHISFRSNISESTSRRLFWWWRKSTDVQSPLKILSDCLMLEITYHNPLLLADALQAAQRRNRRDQAWNVRCVFTIEMCSKVDGTRWILIDKTTMEKLWNFNSILFYWPQSEKI